MIFSATSFFISLSPPPDSSADFSMDAPRIDGDGDRDFGLVEDEGPAEVDRKCFKFWDGMYTGASAAAPRSANATCSGGTCHVARCHFAVIAKKQQRGGNPKSIAIRRKLSQNSFHGRSTPDQAFHSPRLSQTSQCLEFRVPRRPSFYQNSEAGGEIHL